MQGASGIVNNVSGSIPSEHARNGNERQASPRGVG